MPDKLKYVVAGDFHLGYQDTHIKTERIYQLLLYCRNHRAQLILLGDIFDFWRRQNTDILDYNRGILSEIPFDAIWLKGNHDIIQPDTAAYFDDETFWFEHGYTFDIMANMESLRRYRYESWASSLCLVGDTLGGVLSAMWNFIPFWRDLLKIRNGTTDTKRIRNFVENPVAYMLTGIPKERFVIYGHTHEAYIGSQSANPGSFADTATFLTISEDNKIELKSVHDLYSTS